MEIEERLGEVHVDKRKLPLNVTPIVRRPLTHTHTHTYMDGQCCCSRVPRTANLQNSCEINSRKYFECAIVRILKYKQFFNSLYKLNILRYER